jgi:Tat protein secretion system quality control protein TatD with DNase activity
VVDALAEMHQAPLGDLARQTAANFHTLFRP